jgi:hypothetical protein
LSELTPLQRREGFFLALAQSIKDVQGIEVLQMTQVFEQAALRGGFFILRCNNIFLAHGDLLALCIRSSCLRLSNKESLAGRSMSGVYSE